MMEKCQVSLEPEKGKAKSCSLKCFFVGFVIFLFIGIAIGIGIFAVWEICKLKHEVKSLKNKLNGSWKGDLSNVKDEISKRINDTDNWKRSTDERIANFQTKMRRMNAADNASVPNPVLGPDMRQSFNNMKDHLNALISITANLSEALSRMNTSSESKVSRMRSNLNDTRNYLMRLHSKLTQLDHSLHKNIEHLGDSIVSAVKDLREELSTLKNSTTTKANDLWKHWNRTDQEIEDIIKLMTQQNETFHFKIGYHSDVLYSNVKDLEKKQNLTSRNLKKLGNDLNHTRENLQHRISRVNKTLHNKIESLAGFLRSSLVNVNVKVDKIKKDFDGEINNILKKQKEFQAMKTDYTETKASFQEKDRKHDSDISSQGSKIKSLETKMKDLKREVDSRSNQKKEIRDLKREMDSRRNEEKEIRTDLKREVDSRTNQGKEIRDLKRRVENIENKASGMSNTNAGLIFSVTFVLYYIFN